MAKLSSHRELIVWQKAMDLAVETYGLTSKFPAPENYRLVSQLARAVASVPANIAEGSAGGTRRDYANFLSIAKGSLMEVETMLMLSIRLNYLTSDQASTHSIWSQRSARCLHRFGVDLQTDTGRGSFFL